MSEGTRKHRSGGVFQQQKQKSPSTAWGPRAVDPWHHFPPVSRKTAAAAARKRAFRLVSARNGPPLAASLAICPFAPPVGCCCQPPGPFSLSTTRHGPCRDVEVDVVTRPAGQRCSLCAVQRAAKAKANSEEGEKEGNARPACCQPAFPSFTTVGIGTCLVFLFARFGLLAGGRDPLGRHQQQCQLPLLLGHPAGKNRGKEFVQKCV